MPSDRVSVISGIRRIWFGRPGHRRGRKPATTLEKIVYGTLMLATMTGVLFVIYGPDYQYVITVTNGESRRVYYTPSYQHSSVHGSLTIYQEGRVMILSGDEISIERKPKNAL
jgi:hypothetical protein